MKKWNEENPGRAKEAMTQVPFFSILPPIDFIDIPVLQIALLWKDAPENPKRGQNAPARKSKAKVPKEPKAAKPKAPTKKSKKAVDDDEDPEKDAGDSDPVEDSNDDAE